MSNSSNQVESIFSKLELECNLEKENKKLREEKELLEIKIQELEQREIERTKNNPDVQTVVLYLHATGAYMFCKVWQEEQFSLYDKNNHNPDWGNGM
jgi:hypothetical protein